ncbi:hypothetical protein SPI_00050 [Niveomyces insectorum RCEF 264]|uniref:ER membrane protein complex subunit 7 beta-sandwich domain-containing protein n=1 Tax=Niveomyces insectorum RCEF 264 TaxID=1081102 RepID=A0A167ZSD5_9HYPO|nr:hypothetical protein SPI_00050 [Niveomyces insectorum RCEF 264]
MRLLSLLAGVLSAAAAAAAASSQAASSASTTVTTTAATAAITFQLSPPSSVQQQQQNSHQQQQDSATQRQQQLQQFAAGLPAGTRATLEAGGGRRFVSAPLTVGLQLVFRDVPVGSYLGEVHCAAYTFAPLRVDVVAAAAAAGEGPPTVTVTETYLGRSWKNRGPALARLAPDNDGNDGSSSSSSSSTTFLVAPVSLQPTIFYAQRSTFSALSVLRNPMILLGLATMGLVFGMPYMMEKMDPEMRAEFEERQRGAGGGPGGFDMAAFLAGQPSNGGGSGGSAGGSGGGGGSGSNNNNHRNHKNQGGAVRR